MKKAILRLPRLTTKKVWIGSYGGHFDIVVVFTKKPKKGKRGDWNEGWIAAYDENKDIVAGIFDRENFALWFDIDIVPEDIEIRGVEQYELTAVWNEFGQIIGLYTEAD